MKTAIVVHPDFERIWPFVADHLHTLLRARTDVSFTRLPAGADAALPETADVQRLFSLGVYPTDDDLDGLPALVEAFVAGTWPPPEDLDERLGRHGVRRLTLPSEGHWAQSVAEYALGLTICGLRRIPQQHAAIVGDDSPWKYEYQQFGDDLAFSNGTVAGKRVRIVGAGNIASRYASWTHMLGADVAAWDPFATEPSFHRAGARRSGTWSGCSPTRRSSLRWCRCATAPRG
ncbi:NAD(P)-dependent oxidoreductase [Phytohabitans flavus]|uniref:NAD(P)-dependent oxidoreductase n=1 Tax=Phytohabitans flavus TaxID=1076124 RepID=UPI00363EAC63